MSKTNNFYTSKIYKKLIDKIEELGFKKEDAICVFNNNPRLLNKKVKIGINGEEEFKFSVCDIQVYLGRKYILQIEEDLIDGEIFQFIYVTKLYEKENIIILL